MLFDKCLAQSSWNINLYLKYFAWKFCSVFDILDLCIAIISFDIKQSEYLKVVIFFFVQKCLSLLKLSNAFWQQQLWKLKQTIQLISWVSELILWYFEIYSAVPTIYHKKNDGEIKCKNWYYWEYNNQLKFE